MLLSWARRRVLLLLSLPIAAMLAVAVFLLRYPEGPASATPAPKTPTYGSLTTAYDKPGVSERLRTPSVRTVGERSNPAMQRAGPPDPEAQTTAAASAESAARAAAELAGAMPSPGNY